MVLLPNLQSLTLLHIFIQSVRSPVEFPWSYKHMDFPLGLEATQYQQPLNCKHPRTRFTRMFYIAQKSGSAVFSNESFSNSLYFLRLASANIETLQSLTLSRDLVDIDFNQNSIARISNGSFQGLTSLERLSLVSNSIEHIENGAFEGLISLKVVDLAHNSLKSLDFVLFNGLHSIEFLYLNENRQLSQIVFDSHQRFSSNLKFIDFRWNNLTSVPAVCLRLPQLERCDCDHNYFLTLENLSTLIENFDPVQMLLADPYALSGEPYNNFDSVVYHRTIQSIISIKDCNVRKIPFSTSWSL